jgi:Transposase DDE domain
MSFSSGTVSIWAWILENQYPSDVSDEEWAFSSPHTWRWGARMHLSCVSARAQRGLLDGLRGGWGSRRLPMALHAPHPASSVGGASPAEAAVDKSGRLRGGAPRLARTLLAPFGGPGTPADGRHTRLADPAFSTPQSGSRGGYDGAKPKKGSKVHAAVDALGDLLALHVSPADEQDSGRVEEEAEAIQEATGESVELASYVDQGYTGEKAVEEAQTHGMSLEIVRHEEAKRGFVSVARRWV